MKPHRQKRLGIILFIAMGLALAVGLTLFALRQNINMFYTPTQVAEGEVTTGVNFRIGGMVKEGSVEEAQDSLQVSFVTTDYVSDVPISYVGILPDLFREGQGIVAEGQIDAAGVFQASKVLAKHDENYMSPEVKAALDAAGASTENHPMSGLPES
ncbi:MAG: cytochrome c maturation protein CcmE [Pseudomonadales bacterium]|nr:cytochrome c maturation protein CcmE [Pseudomonadales bacterium]